MALSKTEAAVEYLTDLEAIQGTFRKRPFKRWKPVSEFPELVITAPDEWETIELAPLYDVHVGSPQHDGNLLDRHLSWIADTPNVLTWNGGDATENITDSKMGHTPMSNEEQIAAVTEKFARVQHKMMFSIPGNHEDRTKKHSGVSMGKRIADNLKLPYFGDYVFCTIAWRGQKFRILAHHGAGGAQTAGAQRNSARKELAWYHPDLLWTGHLHQPIVDTVKVLDVDQGSGRVFDRDIMVIISPSYLKFFGGYAAKMRLAPGPRGLSVAVLNDDGRIDANVHARGRRL